MMMVQRGFLPIICSFQRIRLWRMLLLLLLWLLADVPTNINAFGVQQQQQSLLLGCRMNGLQHAPRQRRRRPPRVSPRTAAARRSTTLLHNAFHNNEKDAAATAAAAASLLFLSSSSSSSLCLQKRLRRRRRVMVLQQQRGATTTTTTRRGATTTVGNTNDENDDDGNDAFSVGVVNNNSTAAAADAHVTITSTASTLSTTPPSEVVAAFTTTAPLPANTTTTTTTTTTATTGTVVPSYKTLLVFGAGTVAIWLSEPLLSLVDTTVVGLYSASALSSSLSSASSLSLSSSLLCLAALGPATVLTDLSLYATYFLALATTSQLAQAHSANEWRRCQQIVSQTAGIAVLTGAAVAVLLWTAGPAILRSMILPSASVATTAAAAAAAGHSAMAVLAARYCAIRAIAAPAAVLGMVAQAVCLATVDVATPVAAVVAASLLNVVGDLLLVQRCIGGDPLAGVAAATAVSSIASCGILVAAVVRKMQAWRQLERRMRQCATMPEADAAVTLVPWSNVDNDDYNYDSVTNPLETKTARAAANNKEKQQQCQQQEQSAIPYVSLPDHRELWNLVQLSLPLAFNMWAKMGCYFALTVKAADFGATAMASHNILLRVFFLLGCFADALGQTAQSFLPATLYPVRRPHEFRLILQRIAVLAIGVAGFGFVASHFILLRCGSVFTSDLGIVSCLRDTSIWTAVALALHPVVVAISGTVIATRNFRNLVKVYAVTVLTHVAVLSRATSLANVWQALVVFQLVRLANYLFWSKFTPANTPATTIRF